MNSRTAASRWLFLCVAPLLLAVASAASAAFHVYRIDQLYSNADGSVQFIVMRESVGADLEHRWAGKSLVSTSASGTQTFVFPVDLPSNLTADTKVLIATQGFAALGLVTPDYVIPNGFLSTQGGSLNFASVDQVNYSSLPTDGVNAITRTGAVIPNVATNFAKQSASVGGAATGPDPNQHGLTGSWYEPATSGQGFEVEVFANQSGPSSGSIFVSWFTYDTTAGGPERQRWYTLAGAVATGQPSIALTIYQNTGGNFNAPPVTNAQVVGTATLRFLTCASAQLTYNFTDGTGRTGSIDLTRLTQSITCSTTSARPTNADFALSGNWYDPATSGQGLTIDVNPGSGTVFVAWYTYAQNGVGAGAAGQRWYTAQPAGFTPGTRSIPVTLYQTTGGVFDQTAPAPQTVPVGSGTLAFQSCSAATLAYNFSGGSSAGASGTIALGRVGPVPPGCVN